MASNKKDVVVIGTGKFGEAVVKELVALKRHVLAIDISETNLIGCSRITTTAIANAKDIESIKALGVARFQTVIVALSENIEIIAGLIELGVKHIIAKSNSDEHERVLRQIGVDLIVRPEKEAGVKTAVIATSPNFIKYTELLQEIGDGYAIGSTNVSKEKWLNKPLSELKFSSLGVSVVSLNRKGRVSIPSGNTKFQKGDLVTFIGKLNHLVKTFEEVNTENESTREISKAKLISMKTKEISRVSNKFKN